MDETRYVKARVRNLDRKRGSKHRDIYTNNADGTLITIQDGAEIELTEYAFNNLNDAVEIIIKHEDQGANMHPKKVEIPYQRYDVIKLGDFYTKGVKKEVFEEIEKKPMGRPKKEVTLETALA
jgi:hypothetical protein